jgi:hypothetical protein
MVSPANRRALQPHSINFGRDLEARQREGAAKARRELIERYSAECAAGGQRACRNVSNLK